jgi:OOP family OmpA-OmpF porin
MRVTTPAITLIILLTFCSLDGAPNAALAQSPAAKKAPASKAADPKIWENYDFVPGDRVVFFTDFSEDKAGNFARGLKYRGGPVEVVERDGINVLRSTGRGEFLIPVGKRLPDRFTLEIDIVAKDPFLHEVLTMEGGPNMDRGATSANVSWELTGAAIVGSGQNMANSPVQLAAAMTKAITGKPAHVRLLMDGAYFKMYTNERRLYNIPELQFKRDTVVRIVVSGTEKDPVYITSIRVAESDTKVLYDELASKGRWATQGILFAMGKSDVQPESRPVLKEIASTLTKHADLKILIEGHTDNVGSAASNLALSTARAAAVKTALVANFAITADRITTKGLGDTKPVLPNGTAEGRAQNRRVEIVKQ